MCKETRIYYTLCDAHAPHVKNTSTRTRQTCTHMYREETNKDLIITIKTNSLILAMPTCEWALPRSGHSYMYMNTSQIRLDRDEEKQ